MMDNRQDRFAKSYADAMFGYANAANAAYWAMTQDALRLWSDAASQMIEPEARPKSWFNPNPSAPSSLYPAPPSTPMAAWALPNFNMFFPFGGAAPAMTSPFHFWFSMFPASAAPAAWPMAYAMMTTGVPRDVAWPAAEANAAMLDAAEAAGEQMDEIFSSFRSDGGHAATVRTFRNQLMSTMWFAPFAMPLLWKWPTGTGV